LPKKGKKGKEEPVVDETPPAETTDAPPTDTPTTDAPPTQTPTEEKKP